MTSRAGWRGRAAAAVGILAVAAASASSGERPAALDTLLRHMMGGGAEKHDALPTRIDYALEVGPILLPSDPAIPVDRDDPATYRVQDARITLRDSQPFALQPSQLGAEDLLIIELQDTSSRHRTSWRVRDQGLKGPGAASPAGAAPFFGHDDQVRYRQVLEQVVAALAAAARESK